MLRQAKEQEGEHVPSHQETLKEKVKEREHYLRHLEVTLGIVVMLIVAFFVVKATAPDL